LNLAEAIGLPERPVASLKMTKAEAVTAILREAIIMARLKPGDPIRQKDLAEALQVSATPVREALQKLYALSIVSYESHHGAQVAVPNRQIIDEVFRVRAMLEGTAVQEAVKHLDDNSLKLLDNLAKNQMPQLLQEGMDTGDLVPYRAANYEFHKRVYSASQMQVIPEMIDNLWARSPVPDDNFYFNQERVIKAADEHMGIVDMLKKRDRERARAVLENHIDTTRKFYLQFFDHLAESEN
jgi:DNA-binding GntR family transcriptional regulator